MVDMNAGEVDEDGVTFAPRMMNVFNDSGVKVLCRLYSKGSITYRFIFVALISLVALVRRAIASSTLYLKDNVSCSSLSSGSVRRFVVLVQLCLKDSSRLSA